MTAFHWFTLTAALRHLEQLKTVTSLLEGSKDKSDGSSKAKYVYRDQVRTRCALNFV